MLDDGYRTASAMKKVTSNKKLKQLIQNERPSDEIAEVFSFRRAEKRGVVLSCIQEDKKLGRHQDHFVRYADASTDGFATVTNLLHVKWQSGDTSVLVALAPFQEDRENHLMGDSSTRNITPHIHLVKMQRLVNKINEQIIDK